jgi:hypothetical protein
LTTPDVRRRQTVARWAALAGFVLVFALGTCDVLTREEDPDPRPTTTTTSTSSTSTTSTTATSAATPDGPPIVIAIPPPEAEKPNGGGENTPSFAERVQTPGVVLLAQLGVALLAALLVAAAIQRVMLGRYGFKIGGLEVSEVDETDVEALEETIANVKKDATAKTAAVARKLKRLEDRVAELEQQPGE